MSECASGTGHFDGHGGAAVQYGAHRPVQHDQGFTGSHWMPPLGDHLLCIAQAAAMATINSTIMKHVPTLLAVSMAIVMQRYYTARITQWRRVVAFIKATKHHHWTGTRSDIIKGTHQVRLFQTFFITKKSSS